MTRADCGYDVSRVPSLKPAGCRKGIAWLPFSRPAATAGTRLLAADIPVSNGTAMVIADQMPAPLGTALLQAADNAYSLGMTDVLRVSAVIMIAGALLVGVFMPSGTTEFVPQRATLPGAQTELALTPSAQR